MAACESMKTEGVYSRVTVRDLTKWLKIYRARHYAKRNEDERVGKIKFFIEEWREKMARNCPKDDFIAALSKFAKSNAIGITDENDIGRQVLAK